MEFLEQLKHPKWQKKRLEILNRDDFQCQECGDTKHTLNVHHLIYFKDHMLWEYDNSLLITYCDCCHNKWHKVNKNIKNFIADPFIARLFEIHDLLEAIQNKNPDEIQAIIKMIKLAEKIK
jgi:5-methylcytosine-specific restriction endonuclease McrA